MSDGDALTCAKHPKVETLLRCATCGTPICVKCRIQTPVGFKCRECGTHKTSQGSPALTHILAAFGVSLAVGMGAAVLSQIGLFGIWLGIFYGRIMGLLILRAAGRRTSLLIEVLVVLAIIASGVYTGSFIYWLSYHSLPTDPNVAQAFESIDHTKQQDAWWAFFNLNALIVTLVVAASAISRIRFNWNFFRW